MEKVKKLIVIVGFLSLVVLTGCGRLSNSLMPTELPKESVFSSQVAYEGDLFSLGVSARLSWQISNSDVLGVVIRRSTSTFPQSITEGDVVVTANRSITSFTDTGLSTNVTYYYSLWTYDSSGQYSEKVLTTSVLTTKPEEDAVFAMSTSHELGVLSVQNIIEISWYAYAVSGIAGYSFVWSTTPNVIPDNVIDTTRNSTTSPALADGVWYFHIKAKNNAGTWGSVLSYGPFFINSGTIDLPEVTITTSNPVASVSEQNWTSKNNISITWNTNLLDSDIAGYSYVFSGQELTIPDDVSEGLAKKTSTANLSNGIWYFHVKGKNSVGQWGNTTHYGPYRIDSSIPSTPGVQENIVFININPAVGEWSSNSTAFVRWQYVGSGTVSGYNFVWDKYSTTTPGTTTYNLVLQSTSPTLTDGEWYFHIRARNSSGQWSQTTHCGPFKIDRVDPLQILNLRNVPANGSISFRWDYPMDDTIAGAVVVRKTSSYPTNINDGVVVFSDDNNDFMDSGLVNNTNYYYSFWTVDGAGNYSQPINMLAQAYNTYATVDSLVSSVSTGDQRNSQMAKFSDGSFVVLYLHKEDADDGTEVEKLYAEVYDQNAVKTTSKIALSSVTNIGSDYSVSTLTNGNFVIVWTVNNMDIYACVFTKAGAPVGSAVKVTSTRTYEQCNPEVTGLSDGNFVVVWEAGVDDANPGPDGDRKSVQAKIYYPNLTVRTAEFTVNQWTWEHQKRPAVASYLGGFVVVWESKKRDGVSEDWAGYGIAARRFSFNGVAIGDEVLINDSMKYKDQKWARVTGLSGGGYAIAWQSGDSANPPAFFHGIYARVYNSSGVAVDTDFLVRDAASDALLPIEDQDTLSPFDDELGPNMVGLSALSDGGFVIAYDNINGVDKDAGNRGDGYGVFVKQYSSTGTLVGGQTQINRFCVGDQKEPQILGLNSGYFVTWESKGQNEGINDSGVYGRKL